MSLRTKRSNLLIIVILLSFLLSSCSISLPGSKTDSIVSFSFPAIDKGYYESLVTQFKELHPEIKIELMATPTDQLNAQQGEVQVITSHTFANFQAWKISRYTSLRYTLEEDTEFDQLDYYPGALEAFTSRNQPLAIAYGIDPYVMYYNWDLFNKNKIILPKEDWNLDVFIRTAAQLTNRGDSVFGYAPRNNYIDSLLFIYRHGGRLLDKENKPSLDLPENIAALEWYARLFQVLNIAPTPAQAAIAFGLGKGTFEEGIRSGKIGMWVGTFSERGGMSSAESWDFNWGMLPIPRDIEAVTLGYFEGYAIYKEANNIAQCWEWIKFLSKQAHPRLIPARPSLANDQTYRRRIGLEVANVANIAAQELFWVKNTNAVNFNKALNPLLDVVNNFVSQGSSPRQALQNINP